MTVALYAGSFDPLHLGHLDVIERAAREFDQLVVAVVGNPAKRSFLPLPDRVALVEASTAGLANVRCVSHAGLTADLARQERADVLVRVAGKELRHERQMAGMNEVLGIRTVLVVPSPELAAISSTVVRELVRAGHLDEAAALVPAPVRSAW